jgi:hypothetical protein
MVVVVRMTVASGSHASSIASGASCAACRWPVARKASAVTVCRRLLAMTEQVRFLSDNGIIYEAQLALEMVACLRAGYPMRGWPFPWREIGKQ